MVKEYCHENRWRKAMERMRDDGRLVHEPKDIGAIIKEVQNDIVRRTQKIIDDLRPEARAVLHNNIEIMSLLTQCIERAQDSTRIINTLGPHEQGKPRIGVL